MKQLLIISGKGGTGKTTVASSFIKLSNADAFADCDVDAPNLHLVINNLKLPTRTDYYGMPKAEINYELCMECGKCIQHCRFGAISHQEKYNIDPYSCEGCGVCEAICPNKAVSLKPSQAGELILYKDNGKVFSTAKLKMGSGTSGMLVSEVKKKMNEEAQNAKFAIIDGSPGIGCPVIASISGADLVLIVAEPSISGISDLKRIVKTAGTFQVEMAVCVNKFDTNIANTLVIEDFCKENGLCFVGKIPFDNEAVKAINNGKTIVDVDCSSGQAVRDIYDKTISLLLKNGKDVNLLIDFLKNAAKKLK